MMTDVSASTATCAGTDARTSRNCGSSATKNASAFGFAAWTPKPRTSAAYGERAPGSAATSGVTERRQQEVEGVARDDAPRAPETGPGTARERRRDDEQHGGPGREAQHRLQHDERDPCLRSHAAPPIR